MAHAFRVWAPAVESVEIELRAQGPHDPSGRRLAAARDEGGWWTVDVADAGPGTDHLISLDHGPGLPDPRSPWQPDGVHGWSRVLDHDAFGWTDSGWSALGLEDALIYEAHVGTFSEQGTFLAAIEHLDQLASLGVTHLELMPVAAFAGQWGWGYDGVDLFAPHPAYGSPDELKALVDAAHERGIAVLLDVVYNHLGPVGNYLGHFGPYFTDRYSTPWGRAVNVDGPGSTEVRRFIVDNALMWLRDYHVDGLRLDAVHALIDTSAVHILEELATAVDGLSESLGRPLVLIAESDRNDPRLVQARSAGGYGLDAHWNDDFHHAVHVALTDEVDSYYVDYGGLHPVADALRHAYVYRGQFSEHRERNHGRPADGVVGHAFVGYVQNHDQIGNRARGERVSHLLGTPRAKVAAGIMMTAPFVPMIFQGQEWAASAPFPYFADHRDDPELADAVRNGRLEEFASFGWQPDDVLDPEIPATYEMAILDRSERRTGAHAEVLDWYRQLIALRRSEPALRDGRFDDVTATLDEERDTLLYVRGELVVVVNLGSTTAAMAIPGSDPEILLASDPSVAVADGSVSMPTDTLAVLRTLLPTRSTG